MDVDATTQGSAGEALADKVAFLSRPEAYPDRPARVVSKETHMSWVFLTDRYAFKLKKPIRHVGQDLRSLEARRRNALEEIRLNRRLAPDVYIGEVALTVTAGAALRLGGEGRVIDWLVQMHRLPAERMLDRLIAGERVRKADVVRLARRLAAFYAASPPQRITPSDYRARFATDIAANMTELRRPVFEMPDALSATPCRAQLDFLRRHAGLFERRVTEGRIVEAHGDLRPEHVFLGAEVAVIDCLEFNQSFRQLDPLDELSFLAMECEGLGAASLGPLLVATYCRAAKDRPPEGLVSFYKSYRACLRAKLCLWHLLESPVPEPSTWKARARRYLELARVEARRLSPLDELDQ
jgi:aminoglycoside phosphotransferase family enzyme